MKSSARWLLTLCAAALCTFVHADESWPTRPVRLIVGYSPGGPVDGAARVFAPMLSQKLGQQVVVENRPGAGGVIGADLVSKASPDGYTLMFIASPTVTISPHIQRKVPFDPIKDFTWISFAVDYANVLVVNNDLPVKTIPELITYARANPDKITFGSAGVGSSNHLSGELLARMANAKMVHVPYKGSNPAMMDVIGGKISMMFDIPGQCGPMIRAGKVRALAVTADRRNRSLPEVPTMAEAGLQGFDVGGWFGFFGPAGLPRPIVERLHKAVRELHADPAFVEKLQSMGYDKRSASPEEFMAVARRDYELWGRVVRDANIERE